jgi:hypothetical protein
LPSSSPSPLAAHRLVSCTPSGQSDMVWCPSYPPSVCSVTEGGGVMQRPSGQ